MITCRHVTEVPTVIKATSIEELAVSHGIKSLKTTKKSGHLLNDWSVPARVVTRDEDLATDSDNDNDYDESIPEIQYPQEEDSDTELCCRHCYSSDIHLKNAHCLVITTSNNNGLLAHNLNVHIIDHIRMTCQRSDDSTISSVPNSNNTV